MGSESSAARRAITEKEAIRLANQRQIPLIQEIIRREKWLVGERIHADPGEKHPLLLARLHAILWDEGLGAQLRERLMDEVRREFDVVGDPGCSGGAQAAVPVRKMASASA